MLDENYLIATVIGLVRQVTGFCKNTQKGIYDLEGGSPGRLPEGGDS